MRWRKVEPAVCAGGDVGGDAQVTGSWSVRFRVDGGGEPGVHPVVTRYFFGVRAEPETRGFAVQEMTEYLICEDPADPGGTEIWGDYRWSRQLAGSYPSAGRAESAAREQAEQAEGSDISWDGRPS